MPSDPPAPRPPSGAGSPARGGPALATKLILFGTLITLVAVATAFVVLSLQIRRETRARLADILGQNQETVLDLQRRDLEELLRTSRLMTESPTLRAALDTYRSESSSGSGVRKDLLATIQNELDKIQGLLGKDLVVVTDELGAILVASPRPRDGAAAGRDLSGLPVVRRALPPDGQPGESGVTVLSWQGRPHRIGCVPIVLQKYAIGALLVGERMDADFMKGMSASLHSEVMFALGDSIVSSSLPPERGAGGAGGRPCLPPGPSGDSAGLVRCGGEEFLSVGLSLGTDETGRPARLLLARSLTGALRPINRSLFLVLTTAGLVAVLLAGLAAWKMSRSILRPLERFVAFVHLAAEGGDFTRRFEGTEASGEVRLLNRAYNRLMDALQEREAELFRHAREDLVRVERLKETEKLASLGRMLSGAAHEINNPLTGVVGNLDLIMRSTSEADGSRPRLEKIRKEARRIAALVRNLLKAAHRDTGQRTLFDLNQLLRETAELRQHDFASAGTDLRLELSPDPITVRGNELELQQVFLNILNNGFDALQESAPPRLLIIRTSREAGRAVVAFADTGPGIKEPGKVFDHFYTTKEVGKGTGLGLSISHAIIQSHEGTIRAENRPERGALFTVALPLPAAGPVPQAVPPAPRPAADSASGEALTASVLVVDDEPAVLELEMALLESLGASPVGARSGPEAVEWIRRRNFDLIVSDLRLPGDFSGKDLFRWVQQNRPEAAQRFIFVTGDTASESTREFLETVRCRFLMKPFSLEDYASTLRETWKALRPAA